MQVHFNSRLADRREDKASTTSSLIEQWAMNNLYCPRCGRPEIFRGTNDNASNFYCSECKNKSKLKSKSGVLDHMIVFDSYETLLQTDDDNPDFFILNYNENGLYVENLWYIPKYFFVPDFVEKKTPWDLGEIFFDEIPIQGKIRIVQNSVPLDKKSVIEQVKRTAFLCENNVASQGWTLDILRCINAIPRQVFTLADIYEFEGYLAVKHPQNQNIRPKIRQ